MAIEIQRLETLLTDMVQQEVPGQAFCDAIARLGRTGRLHQLREVLPIMLSEEFECRFREDPSRFVRDWSVASEEMRQGFIEHARQRLSSLTRLNTQRESAATPAWQEIQRALDARRNDLLRVAFAFEFLSLIEPAVDRAADLDDCIVREEAPGEVHRYLDEATRCFLFGLFTSCAVMCRSVIEEALEKKMPASLAKQVRARYRNGATLGNLLHEVNNNLLLTGIDPDFVRLANRVNDAGKRAVHHGLLKEKSARECLQNARRALELLLK